MVPGTSRFCNGSLLGSEVEMDGILYPEHLARLLDPLGRVIAVRVARIVLEDDSGVCQLTLWLDPEIWRRVRGQGLFHFDARVITTDVPDFEPGEPVWVYLELHPLLASELAKASAPQEHLLAEILGVGDSALRLTESWHLLGATQRVELPTELEDGETFLEIGFSTVWERANSADVTVSAVPMNDSLEELFSAWGLEYERLDEGLYRARILSEHGGWSLVVAMDPELGLCTVFSAFPGRVPEARREAAALELARRNLELSYGSFDLDLADGEVRVRTGLYAGDATVAPEMLACLVRGNLELLEDNLPWLQELTNT